MSYNNLPQFHPTLGRLEVKKPNPFSPVPKPVRRALLLLPLLLAACDPVVEQRQIGPVETRSYETTEPGLGFCMTCMPGLDGTMECGAKFSSFCPIPVTKSAPFAPFEQKHQSGLIDTAWVMQ